MESKIFLPHHLNRSIIIDKIFSLFYSDLNQNFTSHGESHDFWEFVYVDRGHINVETDNEKFVLEKGQICFHRPLEYHRHDSIPDSEPSLCVVSFACNHSALDALSQKRMMLPEHCQHLLSQVLKYGTMVFSAIVDNKDKLCLIKNTEYPPYCEQMVLNYLEIFLMEMVNLVTIPQSAELGVSVQTSFIAKNHKKQLVDDAVEYLSQNIFSKIKIPAMCSYLNCSKTTLSVAFKSYTGMSIIQYQNKLKIEKAKDIIRSQDLNLTQISELLNFCSINYFSNSFKSYTGMYPSEYAKSIKIRNHTYLLSSDRGAEIT
ncbi:AraC family transcriptional regulator [Oscillospiraceae bacterium PP1C4]